MTLHGPGITEPQEWATFCNHTLLFCSSFFGGLNLACQVVIALVNVNRLPKGSATDTSLLPQGISSIPGRAYL
jgi:hypothetical protein